MKQNQQKQGFSIIELLIVISVIGLLASIVLIGLGGARAKGRDSKRLSDLAQMRTGLELYYAEAGGYPDSSDWNSAYVGNTELSCNGRGFFVIPDDPTGFPYIYTPDGTQTAGCGTSTVWTSFEVQFDTEAVTNLGPPGTYYLSPLGFNSVSTLSAAGKARKTCPPKSKGKGCNK